MFNLNISFEANPTWALELPFPWSEIWQKHAETFLGIYDVFVAKLWFLCVHFLVAKPPPPGLGEANRTDTECAPTHVVNGRGPETRGGRSGLAAAGGELAHCCKHCYLIYPLFLLFAIISGISKYGECWYHYESWIFIIFWIVDS